MPINLNNIVYCVMKFLLYNDKAFEKYQDYKV